MPEGAQSASAINQKVGECRRRCIVFMNSTLQKQSHQHFVQDTSCPRSQVMRKNALFSLKLMRLNIMRIQAPHSIVSCQCSRQSRGLDRCNPALSGITKARNKMVPTWCKTLGPGPMPMMNIRNCSNILSEWQLVYWYSLTLAARVTISSPCRYRASGRCPPPKPAPMTASCLSWASKEEAQTPRHFAKNAL